jgi:predicted  nucleic acid-binding Zn-ribbon protein
MDLRYCVLRLETDYLTAEYDINSLEGRFDLVERRRDKERDELKRTIKELQDEVVSLKRSISETADYIDEKLERVPKLRKCTHICIDEEPTVLEVRRYVFHNLNQPR